MNKIKIHVGPHKTGSTQIQYFCDQNREELLRNSIFYYDGIWHPEPASFISHNPLNFVHNIHSGRFKEGIFSIKKQDLLFMECFLNKAPVIAPTTVISYEGFASLSTDEFMQLKNVLETRYDSVEVIYYWRSPASFAASEMSQRARMGTDISPESLYFPYKEFDNMLTSVFDQEKVTCINFDDKRGIIGSFLPAIGTNAHNNFNLAIPRLNSSLSHHAFQVALELKKLDPKASEIGNEFNHKYESFLTNIDGPKIRLTNKLLENVLALTEEDTSYITKKYDLTYSKYERIGSEPEDKDYCGIAKQIHQQVNGKKNSAS